MSDTEAVQRVSEVLGVPADAARFLLDAAHGDADAAVAQYFADSERGVGIPAKRMMDDEEDEDDEDAGRRAAAPTATSWRPPAPEPAAAKKPSAPPPTSSSSSSSSSRIRTLNDMRASSSSGGHGHAHGDDEESDDEGGEQEYYAGGKSSGVAIQGGPSDGRKKPLEVVGNILKTAQETGQREQVEGPPPGASSSSQAAAARGPRSAPAFRGAGYRLGESMEEPSMLPDAAAAGGPPAGAAAPAPEEEPQNHALIFWRNGFSIDDGPLRAFTDPANVQFLEAINRGMVPPELRARFGQQVNITVQQRMGEDYVPPPKVLKPFSGHGNRLGDATEPPPSAASAAAVPLAPAVQQQQQQQQQPTPVLDVNESKPVTSIQLRLADGTRLVAKFNHTHTIGDIRAFVRRSRPGEGQRAFVLSTTFPTRELTDDAATIADAGLLNAVIVQRYK